jgi:hypothetical protein
MFLPYGLLYLLIHVAPAIAAFYFWRRSGHSGFAWIAAGYGSYVLYPHLISIFVMSFGLSLNSMTFTQLIYGFQPLFPILMIVGMRSLFVSLSAELPPQPDSLVAEPSTPPNWPEFNWPEFKRKSFAVAGIGLMLGGAFTIFRGIILMMNVNGELADLGAGPGAIVVGGLCLALAFHPRSPLNAAETRDQPTERSTID